jgi:cytochrome c-type biogenesis protein CcmH
MIRRLVIAVIIALAIAPAAALAAAAPRASLTEIENDVMCVACKEPLAVAQSPQADSERAYIRTMIARGQTKPQIERSLVGQYGPAVLGKPPAHGFNLTVYVIPPAILVAGLTLLAVVLPRWRRRANLRTSSGQGPPLADGHALNRAEAARLDEELARFDG